MLFCVLRRTPQRPRTPESIVVGIWLAKRSIILPQFELACAFGITKPLHINNVLHIICSSSWSVKCLGTCIAWVSISATGKVSFGVRGANTGAPDLSSFVLLLLTG